MSADFDSQRAWGDLSIRVTVCPICHNVIVKDAHGGPHPSPGDHDTGPHVAKAYGLERKA